jgi:hypothetical protein
MPLLYVHLSIAKEAADLLGHPLIGSNMGCYLGGSISPDAHLVCDISRKDTHFFDLEDAKCDSGTAEMFAAHPDLANRRKPDAATKSFIAGYLSHLVTDEVWILDIYRPLFGNASPLGGDSMANMYDRLLQFEIDRRERDDETKLEQIRSVLNSWEPDGLIDFISFKAIQYWREFGCASVNRRVTIDDFSTFAKSFLQPKLKMDEAQLEQFLSTVHEKLEWVVQYATPERIEAFRQKAIERSIKASREYLNENT